VAAGGSKSEKVQSYRHVLDFNMDFGMTVP
jgi:hypothetical protein